MWRQISLFQPQVFRQETQPGNDGLNMPELCSRHSEQEPSVACCEHLITGLAAQGTLFIDIWADPHIT
jgi:hypothetical protein